LLRRWLAGGFELVVSVQLLAELDRALRYPKLRSRVTAEEAQAFIELLRGTAMMGHDAASPHRLSRDPGDDYLLALARSSSAMLVSGDQDLLEVKNAPVASPRSFLSKLA
jgi:putative PIN family toxin of toxin-antitoxin system